MSRPSAQLYYYLKVVYDIFHALPWATEEADKQKAKLTAVSVSLSLAWVVLCL
jgi:NADH:ubiquinone oxidoreductase subunit 2 (subunit N)